MGDNTPKLPNLTPLVYLSKDLEKPAQQKVYIIDTLRMRKREIIVPHSNRSLYSLSVTDPIVAAEHLHGPCLQHYNYTRFEQGPRFFQFLKSVAIASSKI